MNDLMPPHGDRTENGAKASSEPSRVARFLFLNPALGILLSLLFALGGLMAYSSMVKESNPDLALPQATIQTEWPGADPETIEKQITNEIEKKIKSLKGLKRVRSASFNSYSVIAVEFRAEADLAESMQLLRSKVRDAEPELPADAKKPKIEQVSVDDTPIVTIALFGDLDPAILAVAAKDLADRCEKIPGVKKVKLAGKRDEVVQVQLRLDRLYALGISPTTVRERIKTANLDMPLHRFEHEDLAFTLRLFGRFRDVEDLRELPIARIGHGRVVRLGEIAIVKRDLEEERNRVSFGAREEPFRSSVDVSILKVPGTDTIKVVRGTIDAVEEFKKSTHWPYGMQYTVTSDQSIFIWDQLQGVFKNGWQAMLAVFIILFVVLTWREATMAALAIPLTFLGSLAVLQALGYTLNQVVVVGMVLALGLLVDVFILMMEGLHDGMFSEGLTFDRAALKTVRTYGMPAFSGQMTTILALMPLMFVGGVDGKFIRIIPVTAIACLVLSFIIALLVAIPLARFVMPPPGTLLKKTRIDRLSEAIAERIRLFNLKYTIRDKKTALSCCLATVALFVISVAGFSLLPTELYPEDIYRKLGVVVEMPPGTTLDSSQKVADEIGSILRKKPYFDAVMKFVGQKSPFSCNSIGEALSPETDTNLIGFSCVFSADDKLDQSKTRLLAALRTELLKHLQRHPGTTLVLTPETGNPTGEDPVQIEIVGDDMDVLREISSAVQAELRSIPGTSDVRDNLGQARLDVKLVPKREALDFHRISQDDLAYQLRFAMTNDEIGKFPLPGTEKDLKIRLGIAWPSRKGELGGPTNIEELEIVRLLTPDGRTVSAQAVMEPVVDEAPQCITHKNGRRAITIKAKTRNRTVGQILADFEPRLKKLQESWPGGYSYYFGGEAEASAETFGSSTQMFVVAIFLVFALLVLQFGSFTQPFIILLSVLFALIGTFGGFFLAWIPFSFPAMVGMISLVGIVVNDSIVMIDTMNSHRRKGSSVQEAAARGATDRFRPIISTTVTTVVGLVPLALSNPMWMPLCNAIIFGLVMATAISQLVVPCLYVLFTRESSQPAYSR